MDEIGVALEGIEGSGQMVDLFDGVEVVRGDPDYAVEAAVVEVVERCRRPGCGRIDSRLAQPLHHIGIGPAGDCDADDAHRGRGPVVNVDTIDVGEA